MKFPIKLILVTLLSGTILGTSFAANTNTSNGEREYVRKAKSCLYKKDHLSCFKPLVAEFINAGSIMANFSNATQACKIVHQKTKPSELVSRDNFLRCMLSKNKKKKYTIESPQLTLKSCFIKTEIEPVMPDTFQLQGDGILCTIEKKNKKWILVEVLLGC